MRYYPIFLDLRGKPVVVVGGGAVGLRKVRGLLACGARVRLVSPEALPALRALARRQRLRWSRRRYRAADLRGMALAIAATDDASLQERVASDARSRRIPVNVVDRPPLCDFIAPAVVRRGDVQIAVSTGGASPALSKRLRRRLESSVGPEYGRLASMLRDLRPAILRLPRDRKRSLWECVVSEAFLKQIREEGPRSAARKLKGWIHGNASL